MKVPELSIIITVLLLLFFSFAFFRYSLIRLKSKIESYKKGAIKSKQINKLVRRMNALGKLRFYCYYGIFIWGFLLSMLTNLFLFVDDKFFDKEEVVISDYLVSFLVQFGFLTIYGLFYARTAWKSYHEN